MRNQKFAYLAQLTDAELERHIDHLQGWIEFDVVDLDAAVDERERRRPGAFVLTPFAEDYIRGFGRRAVA